MREDGGDERLAAVANWRDSTLFSEAERVALDYAERMTITGQKVDDALFTQLKRHYNEAQIVELTAAIALENFRSKFNPALGVVSGRVGAGIGAELGSMKVTEQIDAMEASAVDFFHYLAASVSWLAFSCTGFACLTRLFGRDCLL